jgi:hypothetical protein
MLYLSEEMLTLAGVRETMSAPNNFNEFGIY